MQIVSFVRIICMHRRILRI